MAITIRQKKLRGGQSSLYLDICYRGTRSYEFLDIILKKEKSLSEREFNKEMRLYAERVASKRWNEILCQRHSLNIEQPLRTNFFTFAEQYINENVGFKRGYTAVVNLLKQFHGKNNLFNSDISERYLNQFYNYLESKLNGETPSSYFKRLKKLLKAATKEGVFAANPAADIRCRSFQSGEKDTLTFEEIKRLAEAKCPNDEVKRAFLFSCMTGLRWCDLNTLQGTQISEGTLIVYQKKTKIKAIIALNPDAQRLVEGRCKGKELVFRLPSHTACLKNLRKWMKNAEITKKIRFHEARHSFGTNLIAKGADIYTTSKLLGHTSLKHTTRYVRDNSQLKQDAVNKFPELLNDLTHAE